MSFDSLAFEVVGRFCSHVHFQFLLKLYLPLHLSLPDDEFVVQIFHTFDPKHALAFLSHVYHGRFVAALLTGDSASCSPPLPRKGTKQPRDPWSCTLAPVGHHPRTCRCMPHLELVFSALVVQYPPDFSVQCGCAPRDCRERCTEWLVCCSCTAHCAEEKPAGHAGLHTPNTS